MLPLPCQVSSTAKFGSMTPHPTKLTVMVLLFSLAAMCAAQAEVAHGKGKPPTLGALSKLDIASKTYAWVSFKEVLYNRRQRSLWKMSQWMDFGPTVTVQRPKDQNVCTLQLACAPSCCGRDHAYRNICH